MAGVWRLRAPGLGGVAWRDVAVWLVTFGSRRPAPIFWRSAGCFFSFPGSKPVAAFVIETEHPAAVALPLFPDDLLKGCLRQERAAQEALYRHFIGRVLGTCLRYARSRTQAEDLAQEAFIRVFQRLPQFRADGPLEAWVRRVTVSTCLDHYRSEARRWREVELDAASELTSDDADALGRLSQQDLVSLINRLPDGYRMVLNLYCLEGYSHKEIAAQLGIEEKTSSSQLFKARRLLAELVRRSEIVISNELS